MFGGLDLGSLFMEIYLFLTVIPKREVVKVAMTFAVTIMC